ncbi:MAG: hypothetical protein LBE09_00465, partial [Christensenellaceae bacterium]|nr:hypothetical protein [Christensenellaceae bacterium]
ARNVTFTAYIEDTPICSITVDIVKPISLLVLDKSAYSDARGIALKNYYGNKRYAGGDLVANAFQIGIVFPLEVNIKEELLFISNDASLATVDSEGLVTLVGDFAGGKTVTITVSAINRPYETVPVERSYTFTVYNGVDCHTPDDIYNATENGHDVYFRNDMKFVDGDKGIKLKTNLYGNGYALDGIDYVNKGENTGVHDSSERFNIIMVNASNVTISNVIIRNDDPSRISIPDGLRGPVIQVGWKTAEYITGVRLEYSIFENGFYGVDSYNAQYTIDGCIVRNISNFGIHICSADIDGTSYSSDVTIKNSVLNEIVAPSIAVTTDTSSVTRHSTLTVEGFLDIYNWQQLNSMRLLDRDLVEDPNLNNILKGMISSLLASEFAKSRYDSIRYTKDDVSYLHLGILTAGAIYPYKGGSPKISDTRIKAFPLEALSSGEFFLTLHPVILYNYDINSDILPESTVIEDAELYKRLRGESN